MRRRDFITLLGSAAAAWPLAARAQPKERRLGILMGFSANDADAQARLAAFRHKLAELGWTDSKNNRIEERWASGNLEQMQPSAADLIATSPDALRQRPDGAISEGCSLYRPHPQGRQSR